MWQFFKFLKKKINFLKKELKKLKFNGLTRRVNSNLRERIKLNLFRKLGTKLNIPKIWIPNQIFRKSLATKCVFIPKKNYFEFF